LKIFKQTLRIHADIRHGEPIEFMRRSLAFIFLAASLSSAVAQVFRVPVRAFGATEERERLTVAFWNVENLYDTIPSRFYDDRNFTPRGRFRWNTERYETKLRNLARVIDDMGADIIALAEVENEAVVRDLVMTLSEGYNYIHRTSSDRRGMDLALLYRGDKFFPDRTRLLPSASTREFLLVSGMLSGENVNILVAHLPSRSNSRSYRSGAMERLALTADSLLTNDTRRKLIVMGDLNADPSERIFKQAFGMAPRGHLHLRGPELYAAIPYPSQGGVGSYTYGGRRLLYDNIMVSRGFVDGKGMQYETGGVFVRDYMLCSAGNPLRTIALGRYAGGFSDHLPVYVVLTSPAVN
jgi:endonuclease/exonuclease/phosphatase family metal-dependent hydrolase